METIEIRHNKKKLISMLVLLPLSSFGMTYYIFFSGRYNPGITLKILYFLCSAILVYLAYSLTKKLLKNEPVLILSKSDIEINEKGKSIAFAWSQITDWKIENDKEGNTKYLTIESADDKREINISWLDKKPREIEELLLTFKAK